jgi:putative ABC transport system permease protein
MSQLLLSIQLARRELRTGLSGFRIFISCLILGVMVIAGVGMVNKAIVGGLNANARILHGGDIDLRLLSRPATPEQITYLRNNTAALSVMSDFRAMAQHPDTKRRELIELKAVDAPYPLLGTVKLDPAIQLQDALKTKNGVWGAAVSNALLQKLNRTIGDRIKVGEVEFVVRARIESEPDEVASVFEFGPRFMIHQNALPSTQLIQPGSQIHFHYRLKLTKPNDTGPWIKNLKLTFPTAGWRIRTKENAAPGVRRFIERMTLFLTFVSLSTLLVGGIGIGNAVRSYLDRQTPVIATLKCLGAPRNLIFLVYFIQILFLSAVGITAGLILGTILPLIGLALITDSLPVRPLITFYPVPLIIAAVFGILTTVTFSLWPLGRAREIPAAQLFRDRIEPGHARPGRAIMLAFLTCAALLAALTVFTASDKGFALWFIGGTIITLILLRLGATLLMALARRFKKIGNSTSNAAWQHGLVNLYRPGAATPNIVMSLGVGLSVLVAIISIEQNLRYQIDSRIPEQAPAFFFIDIQPHQINAFQKEIKSIPGAQTLRHAPTLRGRIVAINGTPVEKAKIEAGVRWAVRGDRALTYARTPAPETEIIEGAWWPPDYKGPPLISFDAKVAKGFGVGIGDTLTFNILGRNITAKIASLRNIDWRSLRFDFAVIFTPGVLENAPHTHLAALQAPPELEQTIEQRIAEQFSNVTSIRVRDALEAAANMLSGISAAVQGAASIALIAGALVLGSVIAAGQERRIYDAVIFKVLGARRRNTLKTFLVEYGILGFCTGTIAAAIGTLMAWGVVTYLMGMTWSFFPGGILTVLVICLSLTIALGFSGTWRALGAKAAPYLRNK